jgi:hypothetical protein
MIAEFTYGLSLTKDGEFFAYKTSQISAKAEFAKKIK